MLAIWLALSPSYIKPRATYENAERHTHSARPTAIKSIGQCKTEHPTIIMWLYRWQLNELATTSYEMHMNCWNRFAGWIFGLFFSFEISVILHPDTQNTNSIDTKKNLSHSNVRKKKRISQIITIISKQMSWEFVCISLSCAYGVKLLLFKWFFIHFLSLSLSPSSCCVCLSSWFTSKPLGNEQRRFFVCSAPWLHLTA